MCFYWHWFTDFPVLFSLVQWSSMPEFHISQLLDFLDLFLPWPSVPHFFFSCDFCLSFACAPSEVVGVWAPCLLHAITPKPGLMPLEDCLGKIGREDLFSFQNCETVFRTMKLTVNKLSVHLSFGPWACHSFLLYLCACFCIISFLIYHYIK